VPRNDQVAEHWLQMAQEVDATDADRWSRNDREGTERLHVMLTTEELKAVDEFSSSTDSVPAPLPFEN
jgi:hypothetical protein